MAVDRKCSKEGESLCSAEYLVQEGQRCQWGGPEARKATTVIYLFWVYTRLHTLVCLDFNDFSNARVQFSVVITFPFKYIFVS